MFIYKVNSNTAADAFQQIFKTARHKYPTALSKSNKKQLKSKTNTRIFYLGSFIWNTILGKTESAPLHISPY